MKRLIFVILLLLAMPLASAEIIISEIELNPAGEDSGNEWIELFSDAEINLEGYKLVNNDSKEFMLNETINGYYAVTFQKRWLVNDGEKIILMKNNASIYETPLLNDPKNNDMTWNLCNNEWKFMNSTKGKENCPIEEPEVIDKQLETAELTIIKNETIEEQTEEENTEPLKDINLSAKQDGQEEIKDNNIIDITGQAIKQEEKSDNTEETENNELGIIYESKSEKMKKNGVYIFAALLLGAIAYILLKDKA